MQTSRLGILALLVGVVALGLAILPAMVLDRPTKKASEVSVPLPVENSVSLHDERDARGGITFKIKSFSVTLGDKAPDEPSAEQIRQQQALAYENAASDRAQERRYEIIHRFSIAAIGCALIGLMLGPIAWVQEKQPFLSGSAMSICCVAIFWQYIILGIAAGVAVVVILVLLSALAS